VAKILLIDDDEFIRRLLRTVLRQLGHAVIEATNGHEGLKLCADADLMILDLFMPEMDGLEFLLELRRQQASVKVIIISGNVVALEDLPDAKQPGSTKMLQKPFTIGALTAAVNGLLGVDPLGSDSR